MFDNKGSSVPDSRLETSTGGNNNGSHVVGGQSEVLLIADELRKSYGTRVALRGLSFTLRAGRVMGFLGPNGAGKTTSIRILTTMLEPSAGRFVVDGIGSEHPEEIRRRIGVLPEGMGFPKYSTGLEYLTYFGQLFGRSAQAARAVSRSLLNDVGMQHRGDFLIDTYSHGMRQRLGIARALVNDPRVIFLDEPTLGLDPRGQQELLSLVQRIARERQAGVVLSSHLLSEIEGICDDVVIMNAGQVVASGTVAEVIGQNQLKGAQRNLVRIRVPSSWLPQAVQVMEATPGVRRVTLRDVSAGWLGVELADAGDGDSAEESLAPNRILEALTQARIPVQGLEAGSRLQDVFLQLTAEGIG
jgi:ABC-2 type transport system ATP-binding protein